MSDNERKQSIDNSLTDQCLPIPIQIFLWKQVCPFVRPKLGKLHEASCMVSICFCYLHKIIIKIIKKKYFCSFVNMLLQDITNSRKHAKALKKFWSKISNSV